MIIELTCDVPDWGTLFNRDWACQIGRAHCKENCNVLCSALMRCMKATSFLMHTHSAFSTRTSDAATVLWVVATAAIELGILDMDRVDALSLHITKLVRATGVVVDDRKDVAIESLDGITSGMFWLSTKWPICFVAAMFADFYLSLFWLALFARSWYWSIDKRSTGYLARPRPVLGRTVETREIHRGSLD